MSALPQALGSAFPVILALRKAAPLHPGSPPAQLPLLGEVPYDKNSFNPHKSLWRKVFFLFLAALYSLQDLSSVTRD